MASLEKINIRRHVDSKEERNIADRYKEDTLDEKKVGGGSILVVAPGKMLVPGGGRQLILRLMPP